MNTFCASERASDRMQLVACKFYVAFSWPFPSLCVFSSRLYLRKCVVCGESDIFRVIIDSFQRFIPDTKPLPDWDSTLTHSHTQYLKSANFNCTMRFSLILAKKGETERRRKHIPINLSNFNVALCFHTIVT